MAVGKEIRTKISSVQSTQKITSAMEMVAASKMRRAQDLMSSGKPYASHIRGVIGHLANAQSEFKLKYLAERENVKRVAYIIVSTDRGLCGGLNINLFKQALKSMKEWDDKGVEIDVCAEGKKAEGVFASFGSNIVASATDLGDEPSHHHLWFRQIRRNIAKIHIGSSCRWSLYPPRSRTHMTMPFEIPKSRNNWWTIYPVIGCCPEITFFTGAILRDK